MTIQDLMTQHNMSQNALLRAINANRLEKWKKDRTKKKPMVISHGTLSTVLNGGNCRMLTLLEVLAVFDCELEIVKK